MVKKLPIKITAAVMACVVPLTVFSACDDGECEHAYRWTVLSPATCTEEGLQEGLCGLCGFVTQAAIEIDPENHDYGEWDITMPSETAQGGALKVCSRDSTHTFSVDLPALNDEQSYNSVEMTTPVGVVQDGIKTYVLQTDAGQLSFDVSVPARGVQSVADAVEASAIGKSLVRSASGTTLSGKEGTAVYIEHYFNYEFGDNYTHSVERNEEKTVTDENGNVITVAASSTDRWCALDENGEFYGYRRGDNGFTAESQRDYINGSRFTFGYSDAPRQEYFGAEDLLAGIYSWGVVNVNGDFTESFKKVEGGYECSFGFGHRESNVRYFDVAEVEFTLSENYAIKTLSVDIKRYLGSSWELREGKGYLVDPDGEHYDNYVRLEQTLISELTEEEANNPPVNPYGKNAFDITGFDLRYGNIDAGNNVIEINADIRNSVNIINLQSEAPNPSFTTDPLRIYLLDEYNQELPVDNVQSNPLRNLGIMAAFSNNVITITSRKAGDVTLVLRTRRCEKQLKIKVNPVAPTALLPAVYENSGAEYILNTSATSALVYAGQELYFFARPNNEEAAYTDASYTVSVTSDSSVINENIEQFVTMESCEFQGAAATGFVASRTAKYTVTMTSVKNTSISCTLTVNVVARPSAALLLTGDHEGVLQYPKRGTKVTMSINPGASTMTISFGVNTETLRYTYDAANNVLTTSHSDGEELGCVITVNEQFNFVLTHPMGFDDLTESVILRRVVPTE